MDKNKAWPEYVLFLGTAFKCNDIHKVENKIMEQYKPKTAKYYPRNAIVTILISVKVYPKENLQGQKGTLHNDKKSQHTKVIEQS